MVAEGMLSPVKKAPHMLSKDQIDSFYTGGYLLVPEVLEPSDLDPVRQEYAAVLDQAATDLVGMGESSSAYSHLSFEDRYTAMITECPGVFYYLGISLPLDYETLDPHWIRLHTGPAFFDLVTNPKLLDVVESVIGPEIALNPVQQTRMKPPQRLLSSSLAEYSNVGATTWHQDFGAVMDEAAETEMLTVWIAVTDATRGDGAPRCDATLTPGRGTVSSLPGCPQPCRKLHPPSDPRPTRRTTKAVALHRWFSGAAFEVDRARRVAQSVGPTSLELRPPLPAGRQAHRKTGFPDFYRSEQRRARVGAH